MNEEVRIKLWQFLLALGLVEIVSIVVIILFMRSR